MSRRPVANDSSTAEQSTVSPISFEEAMVEVEGIVQEMDGEDVPLEQLMEKFSRGKKLLNFCQSRIDEAQQRVELISSGQDGAELQPFTTGSDSVQGSTKTASGKSTSNSLPPANDQDDDIRLK